jgi:hypothetical protein
MDMDIASFVCRMDTAALLYCILLEHHKAANTPAKGIASQSEQTLLNGLRKRTLC